jgi:long-chain acyl-CoA synthetase
MMSHVADNQMLWNCFSRHAESTPDRVAVHSQETECTYGELRDRALRFAAWLQQSGVMPGERVALLLPNSVDYVTCYLGILRAGAIVVALNPETTAKELEFILRDCRPVVAVVHPKATRLLGDAFAALNEQRVSLPLHVVYSASAAASVQLRSRRVLPLDFAVGPTEILQPEPVPEDVAQIIYTSGTTGRPKGVTLSHRNIAANCQSILEYLEITGSDSVMVLLPFYYSYGNSLLFTHLAAGARLVLATDFVFWNRTLDFIEQSGVTGLAGVPSTYALLLHKSNIRRRLLSSLRYLTCAGGALPRPHVDALREAVPHAHLFLMYGQTEATARLSTLMPGDIERKRGSIGRGIPGVSLSVCGEDGSPVGVGEIGEIVANGPNIMLGYWNDEENTRRVLRPEGLRTGDLATVDTDGFIYIVGRGNDMIKSGSFRLHPQEIESTIAEVAGVAEVAVVGAEDTIWGERPIAYVVPTANATSDLAMQVMAHCQERLTRHKQPREITLITDLPKTSSGKVKRAELRALQGAGAQ